MKKQTVVMIGIIALLLLVVGCIGIYSYTENQKNKKIENTEVFSCKASDIIQYSVNAGEEQYTLIKEDERWRVKDNDVAVLNQQKVQEIVNSASMITVQGILGKRDLKEFEVTDIQDVDLTLADGSTCNLKFIGVKGEVCALRLNDSDDIYCVRKSTMDILVASLDKLRAALVFEELAGIDETLDYYSFKDYDKTETVVRTKTASEISGSKANRYMMEKPYLKEVDDEKFEQLIGVKIPAIATAKYVDDFPENLADYGLEEDSRAELHFKWGEFDETLYLGTEEGGFVHAVRKGQDGVFVISFSQLEFLQTEPFYLLSEGILESDIENIYKITVKNGETEYNITSENRKNNNKQFFVNQNAASEIAFNIVTESINNIKIRSEVAEIPQNTEDIVIVVYFDNGIDSQKISLSRVSDKEYVAFINGKAEFTVDSQSVDALLGELNNISKNPMKTDEKG